jgi:sugar/nucleoside kinase (ribokinase family)
VVVVKAGENGAWVKVEDSPVQHVPAFSVTARDTVGAGDAFCAFMICAMIFDPKKDPVETVMSAARHAAVGSGIICEVGSGIHGTANWQKVRRRQRAAK